MKKVSIQLPNNLLVKAIPASLYSAFSADCELIELAFGDVLCETGERIKYAYFPLNSFISLVTTLADKSRLEVGIIGDEGMLSTSLILGVTTASQHALVQGAGSALRMRAGVFSRYCRDHPTLQQGMNHYVYVLTQQLALTAACTHYHVIEARLARWLLLTRDRAHSNHFKLTHAFLGYMLGVQRVGITKAAQALHTRGLIRYSRGTIDILDGDGLEEASCHCYRQGNAMYTQLLGGGSTTRSRLIKRVVHA